MSHPIVRTCAYYDPDADPGPTFTVYLTGGAFADFCALRWPEPGIWVISGWDSEGIVAHRWRELDDADRALLDATPAGRAWRSKHEGGGS